MEPRDGYISYKIYTQVSLNYQARYCISNKFNFWSVRIYYTSFDWIEMDHTTTLEKKNWLGQTVTFRSYKLLAKMARKFTTYTKHHFRWYGSTNTDTELHVISDSRLTTDRNVVLCQNANLHLSIRSQNRFHNLNYKLPWLHHV